MCVAYGETLVQCALANTKALAMSGKGDVIFFSSFGQHADSNDGTGFGGAGMCAEHRQSDHRTHLRVVEQYAVLAESGNIADGKFVHPIKTHLEKRECFKHKSRHGKAQQKAPVFQEYGRRYRHQHSHDRDHLADFIYHHEDLYRCLVHSLMADETYADVPTRNHGSIAMTYVSFIKHNGRGQADIFPLYQQRVVSLAEKSACLVYS